MHVYAAPKREREREEREEKRRLVQRIRVASAALVVSIYLLVSYLSRCLLSSPFPSESLKH
jgi:uncharacterized protein YbgA (DUF1722 family)